MVGTRCSWNKILYSVENMLKTMFLQYYTKSLIMFYINENFICLYRNDSNRVTWNLKTDVFTNKNSISRIEKWYSGNVYVNGHASYNIHMIWLLILFRYIFDTWYMCVIELIPEERWIHIWQCAWFWKRTVVKCWKRYYDRWCGRWCR